MSEVSVWLGSYSSLILDDETISKDFVSDFPLNPPVNTVDLVNTAYLKVNLNCKKIILHVLGSYSELAPNLTFRIEIAVIWNILNGGILARVKSEPN